MTTRKEKLLKAAADSVSNNLHEQIQFYDVDAQPANNTYLEIIERFIQSDPLLTALIDRVIELEEALGFYADESNWYRMEKGLRHDICLDDVDRKDWDTNPDSTEKIFAGKRARQALLPGKLDELIEGEK